MMWNVPLCYSQTETSLNPYLTRLMPFSPATVSEYIITSIIIFKLVKAWDLFLVTVVTSGNLKISQDPL